MFGTAAAAMIAISDSTPIISIRVTPLLQAVFRRFRWRKLSIAYGVDPDVMRLREMVSKELWAEDNDEGALLGL